MGISVSFDDFMRSGPDEEFASVLLDRRPNDFSIFAIRLRIVNVDIRD